MVFIMRVSGRSKRFRSIFYNTLLMCLLPFFCYADQFAAEVTQAEIKLQGESYVFSTKIVYNLSEKANDALQNGVPLFWNLQVKLQQQRKLIWNKTLLDAEIRYRIQYHALLNMYRVINEGNGDVYNFSTLSAALDLMSVVIDIPLMVRNELDPKKHYLCAVKVNFDRDALPLPLRPIAYIDPQWYLSSDWTLWPLKK
jgi:hypothetical protein